MLLGNVPLNYIALLVSTNTACTMLLNINRVIKNAHTHTHTPQIHPHTPTQTHPPKHPHTHTPLQELHCVLCVERYKYYSVGVNL